jgi:hypothetical protein
MSGIPSLPIEPNPQVVLVWCDKFDALGGLVGRKPKISGGGDFSTYYASGRWEHGNWERELKDGFGYVIPKLIEVAKLYPNIDSEPLEEYLAHFKANPPGFWQCVQLIQATETVAEIRAEAEIRASKTRSISASAGLIPHKFAVRFFKLNDKTPKEESKFMERIRSTFTGEIRMEQINTVWHYHPDDLARIVEAIASVGGDRGSDPTPEQIQAAAGAIRAEKGMLPHTE